jgi:type III secretion protein V
MHLSPQSSLTPAGFAFRFNGVRTLPRIGLDPETILVNESPGRLALMEVEAQATVNPATGGPAAVVSREHKERMEVAGLTTWDPFGYFILVLAAAIRRHAHLFMSGGLAAEMANMLAQAFPALVAAAERAQLYEVLAPTLRELLREGVSIRNLRRILELLLHQKDRDPNSSVIDYAASVRSGLADQIAYKVARNTETLVAYVLDPEIEDALIGVRHGISADWSDETVTERFRDAVFDELTDLPQAAQTPAILTEPRVVRAVRTSLQHEFPHVTVIDYHELPAHYTVQPVASISWGY